VPALLRRDTIRLFEASLESLQLAVASLGGSKRVQFRQESAEYAIEVGLLGTAAELAMAACLVQAFGHSAIVWPSGQYKTAGVVLDEFRRLVREGAVNSHFLVQGVADAAQHRQNILDHTQSFRRLIPIRAGGLHAGRGLLHEATVVQADVVSDFLILLSLSSLIQPYMSTVPRCQWYTHDRTLIVEDLSRRLLEASGDQRAMVLSSLYLVLPDIPNEEPEWLEALERVSVSPHERDITYLLDVIETAVPANLRRAGAGGIVFPVEVRAGNPAAIPINPQYLRRQYNEVPELWHADIATANGRLQQGTLDLPPGGAVREVFALGLTESGVLRGDEQFSAHQSWVHIAASMAMLGTPGPYWFLVRRTGDLGQLLAQLNRARTVGARYLQARIDECTSGIDAIRAPRQVQPTAPYYRELVRETSEAELGRDRLLAGYERNRNHSRGLPAKYEENLEVIVEGGDAVGPLISLILDDEDLPIDSKRYWTRQLAGCAMDAEDLASLVTMLARTELQPGHTYARKAIRRIDFRLYVPPVDP
jgi:hypothetical protein